MKKILTVFVLAFLTGIASLRAQNVFTIVYATSDDGFVNVRSQPSNHGRILARLEGIMFGLGEGILCGEEQGGWEKVRVGNVTGWAYGKYLGKMDWYTGEGRKRIVAANAGTPLYLEDFSGENPVGPVFTRLEKGTIIADDYEEEGNYYILMSAHDNLYVRKSDVRVESVR